MLKTNCAQYMDRFGHVYVISSSVSTWPCHEARSQCRNEFIWRNFTQASHYCARCTSISRTRSSSTCAERHRCLQSVHAVRQAVNSRRSDPRQRRPADRVCYADTAERSKAVQVGWSSISTGDVGDWSAAVDQISWCFVLQTPTDHDS